MSFDEQLRQMRPSIENGLKAMIDLVSENEFSDLRSMLSYHLGWEADGARSSAQGKRIRPLLTLLSAAAFTSSWEKSLPAAVGVELLHNFSLIHDDIQDQSLTRRGRSTVWVKWGIPQAINAGDLMFTLAFQALLQLSPAEISNKAVQILSQACIQLTEGQFLDLAYETSTNLKLPAYWLMVSGKTAALLAACCELGALSAGANPLQSCAMHKFGYALGLAFQAQDDWLGIWGDPSRTGKSVESDLASDKKTLPVVYALSLGQSFAKQWKPGPKTIQEVTAFVDLLEKEGAKEYTLSETDRLTNEALQELENAGCDYEGKENLRYLTGQLLHRSR